MTDQTLHCREAFEKWYSKPLIIRDDAGEYDGHTYTAWNAWQAAWNTRAQASAREGGEAVGYITDEPNHVARFTERGHRLPPGTPLYTRSNAKAGEVNVPAIPDGWQPIETAPKGEEILVYSPLCGGTTSVEDWGKFSKYNNPMWTHWMPLPVAPALSTQRGDASEMGVAS